MKNRFCRILALSLITTTVLSTSTTVLATDTEEGIIEESAVEDTYDTMSNMWIGTIEEGNLTYLNENAEKVVGLKEIEEKVYYFDENGIVQTGWQNVEGVDYYFSLTTGERYENRTEIIEDVEYIFDEFGIAQVSENDDFEPDGGQEDTGMSENGDEIVPDEETEDMVQKQEIIEKATIGWQETEEGKKYITSEDGNYAVGMQTIEKKLYYFNEGGILRTGWIDFESKRYFAAPDGVIFQNQFVSFGSTYYYMGADGSVQTGSVEVNGKLYYFNESGIRQTGWIDDNGKRYFAAADGVLYRNQIITFGNTWYCMGADGSVQTGIVEVNGNLYNADETTGIVKKEKQWIEKDGKRYFSKEDGTLYRNQKIGFGSTYYYMGADGSVQKGFIETADKLYYSNEDNGVIYDKGWLEVAGERYYAASDGGLYRNQVITFGNTWYCMGADGSVQKGIVEVNGKLYNTDETTGIVIKKAQWIERNGKRYFVAADGVLYRNQVITFGNTWYCMGMDGSVQYGTVEINGTIYHTDEETGVVIQKSGWIEKNGKLYFANEHGVLYRDQIITFGETWYCMGADGSVQYGIGEAGGKLYHTDKNTGIVIRQAGWLEEGEYKYFKNENGILYRNQFISFGSTYYYCGSDAAIVTGQRVIDGVVYNFAEDGIMIKEGGWGECEGNKYYKNPTTGFPYKNQWVSFGLTYYYANSKGYMVSGWQTIGGYRYYFYPETFTMARNVTIDGWEIGSDGKAGKVQYLQQKINEIKKYTYVPYSMGGTSPMGWDCSGFTQWALRYLGVDIPRLSHEQAANGIAINKYDMSQWKPGDILVYSSGGYAGHVALYLGDGLLMHALSYKWGTLIQDVQYYEKWDTGNTLSGVRRYL